MELTDLDLEVVAAGLDKPKKKGKKVAETKTVPHPTVVTPLAAPVTRAVAQTSPATGGCSGGSCRKA